MGDRLSVSCRCYDLSNITKQKGGIFEMALSSYAHWVESVEFKIEQMERILVVYLYVLYMYGYDISKEVC
jgi:hypothetical protein